MSEAALARRLGAEHAARGFYLTPSGGNLLQDDPSCLETFLSTAAQLTRNTFGETQDFEHIRIGEGGLSQVYALPGYDDKCVKVVTPGTHIYGRSRSDLEAPALPNLRAEVGFMHGIGEHLRRQPQTGVKAPFQFASVRFNGGAASLQERIPGDYVSIKTIVEEAGGVTDAIEKQAHIAYKRARAALRCSALRFGVGDMHNSNSVINLGNFLVDRQTLGEGDLYVIDLIGRGRLRRVSAGVLSRFS